MSPCYSMHRGERSLGVGLGSFGLHWYILDHGTGATSEGVLRFIILEVCLTLVVYIMK